MQELRILIVGYILYYIMYGLKQILYSNIDDYTFIHNHIITCPSLGDHILLCFRLFSKRWFLSSKTHLKIKYIYFLKETENND